jgi:hypothetical protein
MVRDRGSKGMDGCPLTPGAILSRMNEYIIRENHK